MKKSNEIKMTPIALVTYNRSQDLQRTLDCLKNNKIYINFVINILSGGKNM